MILAGDVGGTKVTLALYEFEQGHLVHIREERFPAPEFPGLEQIIRKFVTASECTAITAACFGVPGPVRGGRLRLTNLPWDLDSAELSAKRPILASNPTCDTVSGVVWPLTTARSCTRRTSKR